jgi:hypothetical protein
MVRCFRLPFHRRLRIREMPFRRPVARRPYRGRVAREGGVAVLSNEWRAWVAENLLLRVPRKALVASLIASGVPRAVAARELSAIGRSPLLAGANRVARLVRRHEIVARLLRDVAKTGKGLERRSGVSVDEFYERYYAANAPVVLTDALAPWPEVLRWTPARLAERFGDVVVSVMTARDSDPLYEVNYAAHTSPMPLRDLCRRIEEAGTTNDFYLGANNQLTRQPGMEALARDVDPPHPLFDDRRDGAFSMWIGPAGSVTALHHDTANVLFCQAYGRKRVLLFPPFELSLLRSAHHGVHNEIDAEHPDLDAFPDFADVVRREVELAPGDGLFIPVGWWHHVRALTPSVSVSFTNFRVSNRFAWYYPGSAK